MTTVTSQRLLDRQYSQRLSSSCHYANRNVPGGGVAAQSSRNFSNNEGECRARLYGKDNNTLSYHDINFRGAQIMTMSEVEEERRNFGLCLTCDEDPTQCHLKRSKSSLLSKQWTPLTEPGIVYRGICLRCHPKRDPDLRHHSSFDTDSGGGGGGHCDNRDANNRSRMNNRSTRRRHSDAEVRRISRYIKFKKEQEHKKQPPQGIVSTKSTGSRLGGIGLNSRRSSWATTSRRSLLSSFYRRRAYQGLENESMTSSDSSIQASSIEGVAPAAATAATTGTNSLGGSSGIVSSMPSPVSVAATLTAQQQVQWRNGTPAKTLPFVPLSTSQPVRNNHERRGHSVVSQELSQEDRGSAAVAAFLAEEAAQRLNPSPLPSSRGATPSVRLAPPPNPPLHDPRVEDMPTVQPSPSDSSSASSCHRRMETPPPPTSTVSSLSTPSRPSPSPPEWSAALGPDFRYAREVETMTGRNNFVSPQMSKAPRSISFRVNPTTSPPSELSRRQTVAANSLQQRRSVHQELSIDRGADDDEERKVRAKAFQQEQDRLDAIEDSANVQVLKDVVKDMLRPTNNSTEEDVIGIVADYMLSDPHCHLPLQTYGICTLLSICCFGSTSENAEADKPQQEDVTTMRHELWQVIFNSPIVDAVVKAIATAAASNSASPSASTKQLVHRHLQEENNGDASRDRRFLCLRSGCELLHALAVGADSDSGSSAYYRTALLEAGALRAVVAALSRSGEKEEEAASEETAQVALSALAAFQALAPSRDNKKVPSSSSNDHDSTSVRSSRSTISASSRALKKSSSRRQRLLDHIGWDRQQLGLAWSALAATLTVMDEHYDSPSVQQQGCRTLSVLSATLSHWAELRKDGFQNGRPILEALLGALSFYPNHGGVQEAACQALKDCCLAMPWHVVEAAMGCRRKEREPMKRAGSTKRIASLHNDYSSEEKTAEVSESDDELDVEENEDDMDLVEPLCYYLLSAAVDFPKECSCVAQALIDRLLHTGGKTCDDDEDDSNSEDGSQCDAGKDDAEKKDDSRSNDDEDEEEEEEDSAWKNANEELVYESLVRNVLEMACKDRGCCPSTFGRKRRRRRRHRRRRSSKGSDGGSRSSGSSGGSQTRNPLHTLQHFVHSVVHHMEKSDSARVQSVGVLGIYLALMMVTGTEKSTLSSFNCSSSSSSSSSLGGTNIPPRILAYMDTEVLGLALKHVLAAMQRHGAHHASSIPSRAAALLLSVCQHPSGEGAPQMVMQKTKSRRKLLRRLGAIDAILHFLAESCNDDEQQGVGGENVHVNLLHTLNFLLMDDGAASFLTGNDSADRVQETVLVLMEENEHSELIQNAGQQVLNCFFEEEDEEQYLVEDKNTPNTQTPEPHNDQF